MPTLTQSEGLPASVHTEIVILGAIMLDADALAEAVAKLHPEDFSLDSHRRIFSAINSIQGPVDYTTLRHELERRRELEAIGGPAYLAYLTEGVPRNLNIESYVQIVKDKARLRDLMALGSELQGRAADPSEDAEEVLGDFSQRLAEIADSAIRNTLVSIPDIVTGSFGSIDQMMEHTGLTGLKTHFIEFDRMTGGLQPSELVIIAARPSMGKTAWAINIAQNAVVRDGKIVAVFSLEMSKEALLKRMLASDSSVSTRRAESGLMGAQEKSRFYMALERLMESKMFIDDTPNISIAEMRAKARRLKQQHGLDLILVDYLQLMTAINPGKRGFENRTQEVSSLSRGLKALAKEFKVPVVALSQLSRQSEQRTGDKKPRLSDLRESGSIEQDADVVAFIHREEYYDRDNEDLKGKAEIIIAKQRNGPIGSIDLAWISEYTKFENLAWGD